VAFERIKTEMKFFFLENIFETDKIHHEAEQGIAAPGCQVPEGLQVHQFAKRRIEKINDGQYEITGAMDMFPHGRAKLSEVLKEQKNRPGLWPRLLIFAQMQQTG